MQASQKLSQAFWSTQIASVLDLLRREYSDTPIMPTQDDFLEIMNKSKYPTDPSIIAEFVEQNFTSDIKALYDAIKDGVIKGQPNFNIHTQGGAELIEFSNLNISTKLIQLLPKGIVSIVFRYCMPNSWESLSKQLSSFNALKSITYQGCPIRNGKDSEDNHKPNIWCLSLYDVKVSRIKNLFGGQQLSKLKIEAAQIDPKNFEEIGSFNLYELTLNRCSITDSIAKNLISLKYLRLLSLNNNNIGKEGASYISKLQNLDRLDIGWNHLGAQGVQKIAELSKLNILVLTSNHICYNMIYKQSQSKLLPDTQNPTQQGIKALIKMDKLQELWIGENDLDDQDIDILIEIKSPIKIWKSNFNDFTMIGIRKILKRFQLQELCVVGNDLYQEDREELLKIEKTKVVV